ncbi:hybrid sensor histidine kinase/response regulator [Synechocystis sp. PCC 7509]|uniref:hybrid sensor histidine kinase/response regulator n=1 Tax=Synechocystis sp. PCC 7509 TaxID=927677 RepID=UPI0002ABB552|nr:ATP-binding protein [Synechocystis sp. PCC 7509]
MTDSQQFSPVENAIALFDESQHLILFNQRLATLWGLSADWLAQKPNLRLFFAEVVSHGYWSQAQYLQLVAAVESIQVEKSHYIKQTNGIYLEAYISRTSEQGYIFTFRDVSEAQSFQTSINAQVRQQAFILGLMERLQPASELREIGEFALSYLVKAMDAAFGDIKIITGVGFDSVAHVLTNQVGAKFIAVYGEVAVKEMEALLNTGIHYGQGLLWQVVTTGKPLFVDDYKNHPKAVPAFQHPGIGDLGIFPIPAANGDIIGVLTLESRGKQKLRDAPQQNMLTAACRMMGVAIERAQNQVRLSEIHQDLEQASQLKSEFLTSMSHELRTPLNSILGFANLLLQEVAGSLTTRQVKYSQIIAESGQHLLQLINDILDLAKIESGKAELELQSVAIAELCTQCLEMVQHRADKKRLVLSQEIDQHLGQVNLDERRVRQMLINLLSNAVKFTPEGGQIKFVCRVAYGSQLQEQFRPDRSPVNPSTPYLCFEVQDTGIGIAQEKWNLLFRPFQQVDASLTREHEGTGLGLALTKRLAELHGGTVSLESVEHQGSTFRVWLPLTEMRGLATKLLPAPPVAAENNQARLVAKNPKRIWVVEDQPYNQELIIEVLELEGYIVDLIPDGGVMMEAMQSNAVLPDLILLDIQLPKVDGFEIVRHLKASSKWKHIPVIAVTAMAMKGDRDRCLAAGANAYMSKPLNLSLLQETLHMMLP